MPLLLRFLLVGHAFYLLFQPIASPYMVTVDEDYGRNDTSCLDGSANTEAAKPSCLSLEYVASHLEGKSDYTVVINLVKITCFVECLILQPFSGNPYCQIDSTGRDKVYISWRAWQERGEGDYKMPQTKTTNYVNLC